jgi:prophage regulatory protein
MLTPEHADVNARPRRLLTFKDLKARGHRYSRMHTDRLEKAGKFPLRVRLSTHAVGWWEDEYDAHLAAMPRGPVGGD